MTFRLEENTIHTKSTSKSLSSDKRKRTRASLGSSRTSGNSMSNARAPLLR